MTQGLVLVAHGSRRESSNDEVRALTQNLAGRAGKDFLFINCAFLELAEPSIPDGIEQCIQQGATRVLVLPYFLSAGRHVVKDIPEEVAKIENKYPDVDIKIAPYLGSSDSVADLLLSIADGSANS